MDPIPKGLKNLSNQKILNDMDDLKTGFCGLGNCEIFWWNITVGIDITYYINEYCWVIAWECE